MVTVIKPSFNKHEIYGILQNFHWMTKELNRIKLELSKVETVGVAVYSDEPKASSSAPSQRIESEVFRREKKHERMKAYQDKIDFIHHRLDNIDDEKQRVVLDCLLDGMRISAIAIHLNTTRRNIHDTRDEIVCKISHISHK